VKGKEKIKVARHLFLIRHGQYNTNAKEANLMILTALGRDFKFSFSILNFSLYF
jgi:hypothetical protein